jgi:hypothetical protein
LGRLASPFFFSLQVAHGHAPRNLPNGISRIWPSLQLIRKQRESVFSKPTGWISMHSISTFELEVPIENTRSCISISRLALATVFGHTQNSADPLNVFPTTRDRLGMKQRILYRMKKTRIVRGLKFRVINKNPTVELCFDRPFTDSPCAPDDTTSASPHHCRVPTGN